MNEAEPRYDVVIVGAGSAGAVIASRVSENPNRSVLLLDAGPDYPRLEETPYDLVNAYHNSVEDHDWQHQYRPDRGVPADAVSEGPRHRGLERGQHRDRAARREAHIEGFRGSEEYERWRELLHHF